MEFPPRLETNPYHKESSFIRLKPVGVLLVETVTAVVPIGTFAKSPLQKSHSKLVPSTEELVKAIRSSKQTGLAKEKLLVGH